MLIQNQNRPEPPNDSYQKAPTIFICILRNSLFTACFQDTLSSATLSFPQASPGTSFNWFVVL